MALIEIRGAVKKYKIGTSAESIALDGVDLTVESGELVAIKGASGAGKSTLMNIIGCTDITTSISYLLNGEDISNRKTSSMTELRNKSFGFVMQDFGLINNQSAINNVGLPLMFNKTPLRKIRAKALEQLKELNIEHLAERRVSELSGGEKQRVAIARSLINNPAVILADEPTGSLDTKNTELIMSIFEELNASGKTIIVITHEESVARRCNRIISMSDGRIISDVLTT
ncbi:hypothetical protein AN964_23235 [Heyndrickxia shackletonii]|uniref:ABC transporter domain-containing protein n=1 Tax=Heyndrickxia shackletonii TaxID=157838 RepID=A0A0Q3T961_9BACI|nr:ABC transporter ATP-binding protein [Heyndrickxia shackletonii]KQL50568.1 hypothetical protein AN964_23235 [Heyndrickxia shackletonii]